MGYYERGRPPRANSQVLILMKAHDQTKQRTSDIKQLHAYAYVYMQVSDNVYNAYVYMQVSDNVYNAYVYMQVSDNVYNAYVYMQVSDNVYNAYAYMQVSDNVYNAYVYVQVSDNVYNAYVYMQVSDNVYNAYVQVPNNVYRFKRTMLLSKRQKWFLTTVRDRPFHFLVGEGGGLEDFFFST